MELVVNVITKKCWTEMVAIDTLVKRKIWKRIYYEVEVPILNEIYVFKRMWTEQVVDKAK